MPVYITWLPPCNHMLSSSRSWHQFCNSRHPGSVPVDSSGELFAPTLLETFFDLVSPIYYFRSPPVYIVDLLRNGMRDKISIMYNPQTRPPTCVPSHLIQDIEDPVTSSPSIYPPNRSFQSVIGSNPLPPPKVKSKGLLRSRSCLPVICFVRVRATKSKEHYLHHKHPGPGYIWTAVDNEPRARALR